MKCDQCEGVRRFLAGEPFSASSNIAEQVTYGYGDIDPNGFWQFPIPAALVKLVRDLRRIGEINV